MSLFPGEMRKSWLFIVANIPVVAKNVGSNENDAVSRFNVPKNAKNRPKKCPKPKRNANGHAPRNVRRGSLLGAASPIVSKCTNHCVVTPVRARSIMHVSLSERTCVLMHPGVCVLKQKYICPHACTRVCPQAKMHVSSCMHESVSSS